MKSTPLQSIRKGTKQVALSPGMFPQSRGGGAQAVATPTPTLQPLLPSGAELNAESTPLHQSSRDPPYQAGRH